MRGRVLIGDSKPIRRAKVGLTRVLAPPLVPARNKKVGVAIGMLLTKAEPVSYDGASPAGLRLSSSAAGDAIVTCSALPVPD
jgi:hypothetical protein